MHVRYLITWCDKACYQALLVGKRHGSVMLAMPVCMHARMSHHMGMQETEVDMEVEFLNLGLDIIGLGVFNYEFGSGTAESPVIKVLLSSLHAISHLHHGCQVLVC